MISYTVRGSFKNTESFLTKASQPQILAVLRGYALAGVNALSRATPTRSGLAASSWGYNVSASRGRYVITWTNADVENGFPVVIALQYGHGTGTGGYVQGRDFINPAIKPVFDMIADRVWKAVTSA